METESKKFATIFWDFQDVEHISSQEVTQEEAEQFLVENEDKIHSYLCKVGIDYLEQLWNEQHAEED